jgi:superfamily I DNA and/or RNA helicase
MAMQALDPKRRVLFLDTSALPDAGECLAGDQLSNPTEASMVMRIVDGLLEAGVQMTSIGLISPYRSQVHSLLF